MADPATYTVLAAVAGVAAALPVAYFEYRRVWSRTARARAKGVSRQKMRIRVEGKLDDKYVDELTTFPTELEGLASLKALYALSPSAISNLLKLGYDELDKRRGGLVPGLPVAKTTGPSFTMDELVPRGYVVEVEPVVSGDTSHWIALSDDGRRLARILTANEAAPTWLWDASQKYHECSERP